MHFDDPLVLPIHLSAGIHIENLPDWVRTESALDYLPWRERQQILDDPQVAFTTEYEAEALGSPDPDWRGDNPRTIQRTIDEKFTLAAIALWLVKPSRLSCGPTLHFSARGDSDSMRQGSSIARVLTSDDDIENQPTLGDLKMAGALLAKILHLDRKATTWFALRMLFPALREHHWETRFLLEWVVLEALFGPESAGETTYRLAQRIGLFIGDNADEKRHIFENVKEAYSYRSKVVHGRRLVKLSKEKSMELTKATEKTLRRAFIKILSEPELIGKFDGKGRDPYLDSLLFR
ncbi:hypothetical protein GCM10010836_51360 [Aminobacter aminovorans]